MSVYATLSYQLENKLVQPLDYLYDYFDENYIKLLKRIKLTVEGEEKDE